VDCNASNFSTFTRITVDFQINIPKQTEEVHWLSFSPVEEHFYRRTYIECSKEMSDKLKNFAAPDTKLSEMDRKTLQVITFSVY
jgi:E3 ubiquitin-protein ligase SHPRH